jgi:hypothetical protein
MLNRKIRNLAVLALPAALLVASALTATPASAVADPGACEGLGGCYLKNLHSNGTPGSGLWIEGHGHNNSLLSSYTNRNPFGFGEITGSDWGYLTEWNLLAGEWGECWNTNGRVIGLDSCPAHDTNEYFRFLQHGNYWLIQSYRTGEYVAAAGNNGDLYFTTGVNDTSLWSLYQI